ncbi:hypothetical protein HU200_044450 [Digitaria exilis]|uniref:Hydrophobin n=1 Tax=Digitaria exilis TaxID=1010633 RepID=A0A835EAT2_9POAL|nr:hypothetical protein HU200_044450 [Digitaria exilis]
MASKSMASHALLLLAVALMLASVSTHHADAASTPTLAPAPSQSLCPNVLSDIQDLEILARNLVDKVEMIFIPNVMKVLDYDILDRLGLLHPGVKLCVCTNNDDPRYIVHGSGKIKCFGVGITV